MPAISPDFWTEDMNFRCRVASGERTTTSYDEIANTLWVRTPLSSFTTSYTASPYYEVSFDNIRPYATIPNVRVDIGGNGKIGMYTWDLTETKEEKMSPPTELLLYLEQYGEEANTDEN